MREKSTSGGVFASIAKTVIESGGVVFGAAMLDSEVKHIGIDRIEDIYLLQGSKYAQSNTDGIYKQVLDVLKNDKIVLFSGLGCQVAGLLNYLPNSISTEKLYTIDLICGGVPTKYLISKYLEHEGVESIYAFRNKNKYELTVLDKRGNVQVVPLEQRPLPLCGFYTELTNKYICYDCRYIGAHRKSDMTIGDYWGDTEYTDEHQKGLSVAVVHNKKIHHLMSSSNLSIHLAGWETFLKHNPRMVYGKNDGVSTYRRKRLAEAIINDSYEKFVIDYANGATLKHPIYFLRKLVRYCQWKLMKDKRREYVLELLKKYSAK